MMFEKEYGKRQILLMRHLETQFSINFIALLGLIPEYVFIA